MAKPMGLVSVNGKVVSYYNRLSSGPGTEAHTYELSYGRYVYETAGAWYLQIPGQNKCAVKVERRS